MATMYAVAGGASHGFVLDGDPEPAAFVALDRSMGDVEGVKLNMTHELFHVAQRVVRALVPGLSARVFDAATAPPAVRMLSVLLEEGTANAVADPTRSAAVGPYFDAWRAGYLRHARAEKIAADFAVFDGLLAGLRSGALSWDAMYLQGFADDAPLYFVGYEMAKAIEQAHGPRRIGRTFQEHPAVFFRDYMDLRRVRPGLAGVSAESERWLRATR